MNDDHDEHDYRRNADQEAADEALTAAINACRAAYFADDHGRILTGYVVAFTETYFDDLGQQRSFSGQLVQDNYLPGHVHRGILLDALDVARGIGGRLL